MFVDTIYVKRLVLWFVVVVVVVAVVEAATVVVEIAAIVVAVAAAATVVAAATVLVAVVAAAAAVVVLLILVFFITFSPLFIIYLPFNFTQSLNLRGFRCGDRAVHSHSVNRNTKKLRLFEISVFASPC